MLVFNYDILILQTSIAIYLLECVNKCKAF